MKRVGSELELRNIPFHLEEVSTPSTPYANRLKLYAKDNGSGVSTLCYLNDAGTETCFPASGGIVSGTGVANRLAYWTSASAIDDVPRTFTAGSVLFAHSDFLPQEDNANFFWHDANNALSIGTAGVIHGDTAKTSLSLDRDGACMLDISAHGGIGSHPHLDFYRSGTSHAAPSLLGSDDFVGSIRAKCWDSNSYELVGSIFFKTGDAPADGATPGTIHFFVTPTGSVTPTERFRMAQAGQLGIGGANYGTSGDVLTSGGSAAAPSWAVPATQTSTLLDGSVHTDTVAQTVSRGSLLYGNATPKWDELAVGSAGAFLRNDGTDAMWSTLILPNAITANNIVYGSATNTYGQSVNLTFDGTDFLLGSGIRARMVGQNRFRYLNSFCGLSYTGSPLTGLAVNTFNVTSTFDSEYVDTDTLHSTVTNPSRITVSLSGFWSFSASHRLDLSGVTGGSRTIQAFIVNGSTTTLYGINVAGANAMCCASK